MSRGPTSAERGQQARLRVVQLIDAMSGASGDRLMPRSTVTGTLAATLGLSEVTVRVHLARIVADGGLQEIRPDRDWRVRIPGGGDLPVLYASKASYGSFILAEKKPSSRGAGQTSFVLTPDGVAALRDRLRERFGLPHRPPGAPPLYAPVVEYELSPALYAGLCDAVLRKKIRGNSKSIVDTVLAELSLLPPRN